MKTDLQKMESIQEKIKLLKTEKNKIEQELTNNFVQVLKIKEAFQIDFDSLVGGVLEIIDTIRVDPEKMEKWRLVGQKFCKSKINTKCKRANQLEPAMGKNYV